MDLIKPLSHLQCTGNVGESWRRFIQAFELYLMAIAADSKTAHCHLSDCGRTGGSGNLQYLQFYG